MNLLEFPLSFQYLKLGDWAIKSSLEFGSLSFRLCVFEEWQCERFQIEIFSIIQGAVIRGGFLKGQHLPTSRAQIFTKKGNFRISRKPFPRDIDTFARGGKGAPFSGKIQSSYLL